MHFYKYPDLILSYFLILNKSLLSPFKGLLMDFKRKIPHYVNDLKDCLNLQCVATTLYIYLVSLCSLVAFGGMLGQKTGNYMVS